MHISPTPPAVYLSQSSTSTLPSGWASPQLFQRLWKPDDGARLHPSTKSTCVGKNHGRHYHSSENLPRILTTSKLAHHTLSILIIFSYPGWNSQSHLKPRFRPIAGRSKTRRAWHAKETPAAWGLRGDASESLDPSSAKGASKDVDLHGWQILYTNMCPRKIFKGIQVSNKDKWIATLHIGASGPNRNGQGFFCFLMPENHQKTS